MGELPTSEPTLEQRQLRAALIAEHGETIFQQAAELSGLTICLVALGADDLSPVERERAFHQAGHHLAKLLETVMPADVSAKVTDCARRLDSAIDMAVLDDIEQREGLPPHG